MKKSLLKMLSAASLVALTIAMLSNGGCGQSMEARVGDWNPDDDEEYVVNEVPADTEEPVASETPVAIERNVVISDYPDVCEELPCEDIEVITARGIVTVTSEEFITEGPYLNAEIGGIECEISVYLNGDFMPGGPPGGEPLTGGISIKYHDALTIYIRSAKWKLGNNIRITHEDGQTWTTKLTSSNGALEYMNRGFRKGPRWVPGTTASVSFNLSDMYFTRSGIVQKTYFFTFNTVPIHSSC